MDFLAIPSRYSNVIAHTLRVDTNSIDNHNHDVLKNHSRLTKAPKGYDSVVAQGQHDPKQNVTFKIGNSNVIDSLHTSNSNNNKNNNSGNSDTFDINVAYESKSEDESDINTNENEGSAIKRLQQHNANTYK